MKKIAVTGGLSSGKSSVCKFFQGKGAYVVSADDIVHQILSPQSSIGKKVIELLGEEVVEEGQFDRAKVAKKVFNDTNTLKALEHILHPAVLKEVEKQYNQVKNQKKYTLFIAEIPLLYEIESQHLFDLIIAVVADPNIAKKRFQEKTNHSAQEFEKRMTHQLPPEEKTAQADYRIENNGTLAQLENQINTLYQNLTQE